MAGEQTKKGAGYGALTGAVSGFFWGLLRGDPLQGAAEGAFVGGATGAVVGGVHGSARDRELKAEFGEVNYNGLVALARRNYPLAREYAAQTAEDTNPKYRHASAWLSALIAKETLGKDALEPYYAKLIESDNDIDTYEDARVEVRLAQRDLKSLRQQFGVQ
ncbi:MAG: glycine zipper family protein [Verrucomicrobiota bacterium]